MPPRGNIAEEDTCDAPLATTTTRESGGGAAGAWLGANSIASAPLALARLKRDEAV